MGDEYLYRYDGTMTEIWADGFQEATNIARSGDTFYVRDGDDIHKILSTENGLRG